MAVFGMQLILTMVMVSVLSKVAPHYSFAKWLLCKTGLSYYMHPSDEELRTAAGLSKKSKASTGGSNRNSKNLNRKGGKDHGDTTEEDNSTFNIPRNIEVTLETSPINPIDVMSLRFYPDYQWLLDFAVCAAVVYTVSEVYIYFLPLNGEVNLSMLWCFLVTGFSLKVLFSLTMLYFRGDDSGGEKAMVILSFFINLLIALGLLIISEEKLDLGLDSAYTSFNHSASSFLQAQGLVSDGPSSKVTFKAVLAFFCAFIGAFYTFPGLRLGKMHWDALRFCGERRLVCLLFHISFLAPVLLALMWVRPLARRYFTEIIFTGYSQPLMTPNMFEITRLVFVLLVGLMRLAMMPLYLQSYLNMASERISELKKEAGKISNREFQRKIARVFYYLCVVTLQYAAPIILCIFMALMCKTLGGLQWYDLVHRVDVADECGLTPEDDITVSPIPSLSAADSVSEASKTLSLGFEQVKKIFTEEFYRGVLGFFTWWCVFSWFISGTFGVLYQSYFSKA